MSIIEKITDVNNSFLSRREIVCNFKGFAGKLRKLEAIDMITKEFKLDGKIVIPIKIQNHTGRPISTGTFYVYTDEKLAKKHVNPVIFERLERSSKKAKEATEKTAGATEPKTDTTEAKATDKNEPKPDEDKKEYG
jgi:ribosomal protein S24E